MRKSAFTFALLVCSLSAQTEFWPGAQYDPSIPTFRKVLGYDPGERIASHAHIIQYFDALAAAAPSRMRVFEYARSWEGRRLIYAAVGSEQNIRRLDEIKKAMKALADPRKTQEAAAQKLMSGLPAVIWLGYGVHGNEISSPDAAMLTAYHLLASRNDKMAAEILANVVVLIDPTQNPDGRDRFVHNFQVNEGLEPSAEPAAAERVEPWPGGRTNHYYFDMNRDWFALTQPETRGRIKTLLEWYPLVFVDLHEMGGESTYYFAPEAVPYNPHLASDQRAALEWFGRNNSRWFDEFGFPYFTREVYDAFYPGYGASWPSYFGSVAMTYENGSSRGLLYRRADNTVLTFRDTVRRHFVASVSTAETAAKNRDQLLANFWKYRVTAIEEGRKENIREYLLARTGDVSAVDKLAVTLADQGIEVKRAMAAFQHEGKNYPTGSYVIPLAQPAKRLIRTLLDTNVPLEEQFLKEQERRRRKKLPDEIYDVTAWSLCLLYNVPCSTSSTETQGSFQTVQPGEPLRGIVPAARPALAYLVPWGTQGAVRFLAAALRENLTLWTTDKGFTQNGRKFPRGTLIAYVKQNPPTLSETVSKLAASAGAEVVATNTGWVEEGVNFGSNYVMAVRKPSIALLWDQPTSSQSAGHTRFVIERQYGYPVTPIRTSSLNATDLARFNVIIVPDGFTYSGPLASAAVRLRDWVRAGGTIIGIGGAVSWMSEPAVGLLATSEEYLVRDTPPASSGRPADAPKPADPAKPEARTPGKLLNSEADYLKAIQPERESPDSVAGVLVRAKTDPDHWAAAGLPETLHVLVNGSRIYAPLKLDRGANVAVFEAPDKLLAGGYLWEENRKQLGYKPFLMVQREGRGNVVAFTADPNYRAYMDGLNIAFLNAVFRGPSRTRGGVGEEAVE
ncbi:MAG: M14 family metallopeptidase [Bryobacteraceae bacterium]|nr:M14 family metallopeptidase [Bryobacteraceae bacterium]